MITADDLQKMLQDEMPAATLRKKLAVGLQQETEEERGNIRGALRAVQKAKTMGISISVFQVVLDALCNETIVPSDPDACSLLCDCCRLDGGDPDTEQVMAVVERMRKDGLLVARLTPFRAVCLYPFEEAEAVLSVTDPSVFGPMTEDFDALHFVICSSRAEIRASALELVLKHGPSMERRLEATHGERRFRYVSAAAQLADLQTLQQMHELLPLVPDGSGRRGQLADYARAIDLAADNRRASGDEVSMMMEYLADRAGDEEVFSFCATSILLTPHLGPPTEWLVARAPQLVEAACRRPDSLSMLITRSERTEFLVEKMAELVDPEVLCAMMRQSPPTFGEVGWWNLYRACGWRLLLQPVHEAVLKCMDGLRWKWLVHAVQDGAYRDVEYMLGMCTREHLLMRNDKGDTPYDIAARESFFPQHLLERLKVVHMAKGAHSD